MTLPPHFGFDASPVGADRPPARPTRGQSGGAPVVSIVTPFYNAGARFELTARSVLAQSLVEWEWIIVDDGSDDRQSIATLARVAASDARIRVVPHAENRGISAARNSGYAAARAEYVLQLDADDLLEATAAEKWLWHLHSHPGTAFVNGHTVAYGAIEALWTRGFQEGDGFFERNFVGGRGMVRRGVHAAVAGYDEELRLVLEDWDFWLRCAAAGHWGTTLDEALDWQHRRGTDVEQWPDWDDGERQAVAREQMRRRFADLFERGVPRLGRRLPDANEPPPMDAPCENSLVRRSPRVLLLIDSLSVGGTDRFNLGLLDRLALRGFETSVVTTLEHPDPWRWEYLRRTHDVFMLHRFLDPSSYPAFIRYFLRSRQPQVVVVSHSELGYRLLPAMRSWSAGSTFVDYLHIVEMLWKSGGYPRMSALVHDQLDVSIASSHAVREWTVAAGAEADRTEVVPTGIDLDYWHRDESVRSRVREEFGVGPAIPVVLFAARLCEQKRPLLFAAVMGELAGRGAEFRAWVAGDGELREELVDALARSGLADRVRLLGGVSTERLRDLFSGADVLFLPSQREGIALAVYEAMAMGVAVVATDVGGQRELVTPDCGCLLEFGEAEADVARFADALEKVFSNAELRAGWAERSRRRLESGFGLERCANAIIEQFERARRLHAERPRQVADAPSVRRTVSLATEHFRLLAVCDWLWREHVHRRRQESNTETNRVEVPAGRAPGEETPLITHLSEFQGSSRARWFYGFKARIEPLYVWGIRRGWSWLLPLKQFVKSRMVGEE